VLHQGQVVEQGTHPQLLARGGWYASLWQSQADAGERRAPAPATGAAAGTRNGNGKARPEGADHA